MKVEDLITENLRKWFKEKWVRFGPDGKIRGACARGSSSEGKPKCLPQSKAHSLGKKGRKYAASKKRREDPNPERSGKAKNVATKKSNESIQQIDELKCWQGYTRVKGVKAGAPGSCKKKTKEGYSAGTTGGSGLGISKSPIVKVIEKPLIEKKIDESIDLKKLVSDPTKLKTYDTHISPDEAYDRLKNGETDEYLVRAVAKDPELAYAYAVEVLEGPFPLGEPAIAKSSKYACYYAQDILKGRFLLGEPAIAKDPTYAYWYARFILRDRFPLGEPAIAKNRRDARQYGLFLKHLKKKKVSEAIDLKKLVTHPKKLKTYDTHISPDEAYDRLKNGETDEYLVRAVAKDPSYAYYYASEVMPVLKRSFPLGEPAIAKDLRYAYRYARDILNGPFPLGEPAIAKDPQYAYDYARFVLKGPFTLGEPAIAKLPGYAYYYAKDVLKGPFPLGKPVIAKHPGYARQYRLFLKHLKKKKVSEAIDLKNLVSNPTKLKTYDTHISPDEACDRLGRGETDEYLVRAVAKDPSYAYWYAYDVLKGPFPLGEPALARSSSFAYLYALAILKGRFLLGEPAIAKEPVYAYQYARKVLKGPFPLGEPAIAKNPRDARKYKLFLKNLKKKKVSEAIDLKNLVTHPKKLKTYDTHISPKEAYDRLKKGDKDPILVKAVAKSTRYAYLYAVNILEGPFPLGEPAIAKDAGNSYYYAKYALKRPFPLGEPAIAEDVEDAFEYARFILKGPFPLGEPAIAEDTEIAFEYAKLVLKRSFPLGEPVIAKEPYYAYYYAREILKGPFKLGEPAIAKEPVYAYRYARGILKGPFPLGEPAIAKNPTDAKQYKLFLKNLKKKKVSEAIDLKKLVTHPKKLKTYDTHISPKEAFNKIAYRGSTDPMLFDMVAKDPGCSYEYAMSVLRDRFPLGEPAIAKNPMYALLYANNVLKSRFELGEPAIMKDSYYAIQYYRTHFPHKRWPEFEPIAAKHSNSAYSYAKWLDKPFKLGEPIMALDPYIAVLYAKNILEDRFKMAEPVIAKSPDNAYLYARDVLKGRFKLGEPAIAEDEDTAIRYARDILKGRFKLAEPNLMKSRLRNVYFNLLVTLKVSSNDLRNRYEVEEGQIYSTGGGAGESYRIMKPKQVDHYDDTLEGRVFKGLQREDEYSESAVFKGLQRENMMNKSPYSRTNKPPNLSILNTFIQVLNKPNNRYTPEYILDHYNRLYGLNHSVLTLKQIAKTIPYKLEELEDALIKGERLYESSTR